jgi:hypothetical protein
MATNLKISTQVRSQLPSFVRNEGERFEAFIRAYFEWLETTGQAIDVSKNLLSYSDVDETLEEYLQYFKAEIFSNIPDNALVDKRFLAKHIRELYYMKGSEKSYKFLFRALFNEDIELYYPKDYILRTSDGRWQKDTVIKVIGYSNEDITNIQGQIVTGQLSGAYGRVEKSASLFELGSQITELVLTNMTGIFIDNETLISDTTSIVGKVYNASGSIQDIIIQTEKTSPPRGFGGGVFHRSGDLITFTSDSGSGANGAIISTTDRSAINVEITSGGSGYVNNLPVTISGGAGFGAVAKVTGINSTTILSLCQDLINSIKNVVLNTGPTFASLGTNSTALSANLAAANVYSSIITGLLYSNTSVGSISQVTTSNYGVNYTTLPTTTVVYPTVSNEEIPDGSGGIMGRNAVLNAVNLPGTIVSVRINEKGTGYSKDEYLGIVNNSRIGTINALALPIITGVEVKAGRYISTKGFLSSDQKLQDGTFYQDFSYVVRSSQFIDKYRKAVKEILHPAGTKLFGEVVIVSPFDIVDSSMSSDTVININAFLNANTANVTSIVDPPYNEGVGLLFIYNYANMEPFFAQTMSTFGNVALGDMNSRKLVFGNNTFFSANLLATDDIVIFDTYGGAANGQYSINVIASNTLLTIDTPFVNSTLSNGSFAYIR